MINVTVVENYEEMSKLAAKIVADEVSKNPDCVLGLATGSSPVGMYKILSDMYKKGELDFKNVKTVNLDEYIGLSENDSQSYAYFMKKNLFEHINVDPLNTHIPCGTASDLEKECDDYEKLIKSLGGVDLQVLGIGRNGHIGFNEPSDEFAQKTYTVELKQSTREANKRFFNSIDEVPKKAITMGIKTILSAKKIILLVYGRQKAMAVKLAISGPITPNVPASALQTHPDVTFICDKEAYSELEK